MALRDALKADVPKPQAKDMTIRTTSMRIYGYQLERLQQMARRDQESRRAQGLPVGQLDASAVLRDILESFFKAGDT